MGIVSLSKVSCAILSPIIMIISDTFFKMRYLITYIYMHGFCGYLKACMTGNQSSYHDKLSLPTKCIAYL